MSTAKVIIADDHPLFRAALKQAVVEIFSATEILETDNFDSLLGVVEQTPSLEIVFLDLHMPGNNGFTGLSQLRNHYPDLVVIMVSSDDDAEIMNKAIDLGAAAFIPKSSDLVTITSAINCVLEGEEWLPENTHLSVDKAQENNYQKLAKQLSQLTPQQYIVLTYIADGQLNKQIAYDLDIKETTVKKHVSAILAKLEVNNRTLAGLAYQQLHLTNAENDAIAL